MTIIDVYEGQSDLCREILDDLPEWFGIPDAKASYIEAASGLPMIAARQAGQLAGIVSLKLHTNYALELYVLGVKRKFHRQGIGRSLVEGAGGFCQGEGSVVSYSKDAGAFTS